MNPPNSLPSRMARHAVMLLLIAAGCFAPASRAEEFQGATHKMEYEAEPIKYSEQTPTDPVAQLQHLLATGEHKLTFDERFGYLPALLEHLKIPRASQTLVFSKTSLQRAFISPQNPRALFFNDDVYIGFIPGSPTLEIAAMDPKLGGVFYTLENEKVRRPRFVRDQNCLSCHGAQRTLGVPGIFVRSIATDSSGELDTRSEVSDMDHCSPLQDRWAGWFVTGTHGSQTHRGNLIGSKAFAEAEEKPNLRGNVSDLSEFFNVQKHVAPTSDIVALMVLEHQAKMHNYITRLNFETQQMMSMYGHTRYLTSQVNAFLRYLLFTEEAPLTEPIAGTPEYGKAFTDLGPFDARGRSLRELDLQTRLFKHPCSFLIHSPSFDALPTVMRDHLLQRLHAILTGQDKDPQFAKLRAEDRLAILEILRETKPNLPDYWRESTPAS